MLPLLVFGGMAYYLQHRRLGPILALRRGASLAVIDRRLRYRGGRKARSASRRVRAAESLLRGLVRRPRGFVWRRYEAPRGTSPLTLEAGVDALLCAGLLYPYWKGYTLSRDKGWL